MPEQSAGEKTEPATPRRREEVRKKYDLKVTIGEIGDEDEEYIGN